MSSHSRCVITVAQVALSATASRSTKAPDNSSSAGNEVMSERVDGYVETHCKAVRCRSSRWRQPPK